MLNHLDGVCAALGNVPSSAPGDIEKVLLSPWD